ncbi:uncharacterized protein F4817DRAFT_344790 [Daldinia loculata]|uniref:uncharacterized protein n=1 Tax=Daldinia loculata TaxID=103429 RepID=UPI0020C320EE|nr:uncharacterized protein F4817DRAFT_344790 [Daldinia loculata]KAI1645059.1 hypothetical protein F4817DRAFT_344790 [Daldinia loculata]
MPLPVSHICHVLFHVSLSLPPPVRNTPTSWISVYDWEKTLAISSRPFKVSHMSFYWAHLLYRGRSAGRTERPLLAQHNILTSYDCCHKISAKVIKHVQGTRICTDYRLRFGDCDLIIS